VAVSHAILTSSDVSIQPSSGISSIVEL
jgi:hypothetical protein